MLTPELAIGSAESRESSGWAEELATGCLAIKHRYS